MRNYFIRVLLWHFEEITEKQKLNILNKKKNANKQNEI